MNIVSALEGLKKKKKKVCLVVIDERGCWVVCLGCGWSVAMKLGM